jgi:two-component system, OmpR family, phosphate regulon response regulator PhoB
MRNQTAKGTPRPRAFVIEDDVQTLRLLTELVASSGLEPLPFTRITSARRALSERVPAVMVVDDELPDGRGAELVRELRANPRARHVKVVFCTAAEPSRRREIAHLGPVIGKPFRLNDIERALAEVAGS